MTQLTRYEKETIINFNAAENMATVYTRDKAVMKKLDKLVEQFPEHYRIVEQTEVSKTYSMPKSYISYRKPRTLTEEQKEQKRVRMKQINFNIK